MKRLPERKPQKQGFSLTEMAIVIAIIGLIAAIIVIGLRMLENSKTRKQMTQLSQIEAGVNNFRNKFNCFPGDCLDPTVISGYSYSGNGNGYLEPYWNDNEAKGFWLHLSLSNMISDVLHAHPSQSGLRVPVMVLNNGGYITAYGSMCFSQNMLDLNTNSVNGALTFAQARMIDEKMDDGVAGSGQIRTTGYGSGSSTVYAVDPVLPLSTANSSGSDKCVSSGEYSGSSTQNCNLVYVLGQ